MTPVVHDELRDGVAYVTLNRPEARNAMSAEMCALLLTALRKYEADERTRMVVLRGAGGHFCAGADIKSLAGARSVPATADNDPVAAMNAEFGRVALAFGQTHLPVIAVLEGTVMGGGFGLACTADVALASTTADFRLPETSLGVIPAQIAPFLVERLGYSQAKRLALCGVRLDAEAALQVGLVHSVDDPSTLESRLEQTIRSFRRAAPLATFESKRLIVRLFQTINESHIEDAARTFARAARGPEAMEGMAAFLQKRDPSWSRS